VRIRSTKLKASLRGFVREDTAISPWRPATLPARGLTVYLLKNARPPKGFRRKDGE
jgi:hypothetical protein